MQRSADIRMIQALRAAACLLVVIDHAATGYFGDAHGWQNLSAGVDLFFVISGYVMVVSAASLALRPDGWRRFAVRRLRRIVPLYWLLTAAKFLSCELRPDLAPHSHPGWWSFIGSAAFIPVRDLSGAVRPVLSVGWTLNFEMLFYALFAAALAIRVHPLWITPALAALALAGFWRDPAWPAPCWLANGMVLEFAAGMALGCVSGALPRRAAIWIMASSAVLLLTLPHAGPWRFLAWGMPAAAILAAAVALEPRAGPHLPAWLLATGDASYAIYLVHPFVVPAFASHGAVAAIAAVPASAMAGMLVHRRVDVPLRRWLRGRGTDPRPYGAGVLSP